MLSRIIQRAPVRTQLLLSGAIAWASDVTTQLLSGQKFDLERNVRFTSTFLLLVGPSNLIWLRYLDSKKFHTVQSVLLGWI